MEKIVIEISKELYEIISKIRTITTPYEVCEKTGKYYAVWDIPAQCFNKAVAEKYFTDHLNSLRKIFKIN
ncbi:MAG: hypothetical protein J6Y55_07735 [Bacteroidales bacterium]|nr:hypothetical protein [Bacteroidales bacterium]